MCSIPSVTGCPVSPPAESRAESAGRSLADTKRELQEAEHERATLEESNGELRDKIKRLEGEKGEARRALDEAGHKINGKRSR